MRPLSTAEIAAFRTEGFLSVADFAPPEDVASLAPLYDALFEARAAFPEGDFVDFAAPMDVRDGRLQAPQMIYPSRREPALLEHPVFHQAQAIARQILGPTAQMTFDHGILKYAHTEAPTPWHQDEAFWGPWRDHDALSIWIPLQPVDERSGCLEFAPGSHRGPVVEHQRINNDPRVHGLEVANCEPADVIACPLPLGGATLHHARTLHHSPPNRSDQDRRAYVLVFVGRTRLRLVPRDHHWNPPEPNPLRRAFDQVVDRILPNRRRRA